MYLTNIGKKLEINFLIRRLEQTIANYFIILAVTSICGTEKILAQRIKKNVKMCIINTFLAKVKKKVVYGEGLHRHSLLLIHLMYI